MKTLNAAGGNIKWYNYFVKLAVSLKVKLTPTRFIPRYLLKRNKYLCPHKDLYTNIHTRFIIGHSQMSINM